MAAYVKISVALTTRYTTDAHFAAYFAPQVKQRLDLTAVGRVDIQMVVMAFDIDCAEAHRNERPASDEWFAKERMKIGRLFAVTGTAFAFRTRGGYRLVYRLASAVVLKTRNDAREWTRSYFRAICFLAKFEIIADPNCADWTRLFRVPHATRERSRGPEERETIGDPDEPAFWRSNDFVTKDEIRIARRLSKTDPSWSRVEREIRTDVARKSVVGARRFDGLPSSSTYVRGAIRNACAAVRNAPKGSRKVTLNREAFALARFIVEGALDEATLREALSDPAREVGLSWSEISGTIRNAVRARRSS